MNQSISNTSTLNFQKNFSKENNKASLRIKTLLVCLAFFFLGMLASTLNSSNSQLLNGHKYASYASQYQEDKRVCESLDGTYNSRYNECSGRDPAKYEKWCLNQGLNWSKDSSREEGGFCYY